MVRFAFSFPTASFAPTLESLDLSRNFGITDAGANVLATAPGLDDETQRWLDASLDGDEMLALARDARLPRDVRVMLAGGAWLRGGLLARPELEDESVTLLGALGADADAAAASTPAERRFRMGRHLLLQELPVVTPWTGDGDPEAVPPWWRVPAAFHDAAAQARQAKLRTALAATNQTTWLGQALLPWLAVHKSAEGPALLEKLVYASRYGANDPATSRRAFLMLHRQYPNSPEARRTRYFF